MSENCCPLSSQCHLNHCLTQMRKNARSLIFISRYALILYHRHMQPLFQELVVILLMLSSAFKLKNGYFGNFSQQTLRHNLDLYTQLKLT